MGVKGPGISGKGPRSQRNGAPGSEGRAPNQRKGPGTNGKGSGAYGKVPCGQGAIHSFLHWGTEGSTWATLHVALVEHAINTWKCRAASVGVIQTL